MRRILLVFLVFSCSSYGEIIRTKYFDVHYAFDRKDRERFSHEIVRNLDNFATHWIKAGAFLAPLKIRIYVQPSLSVTYKDALKRLYGDEFFQAFKKLKQASDNNAVDLGLMTKNFALSYPPFFKKALSANLSQEYIKKWVNFIQKSCDNNNTQYRIFDNNASYFPLNNHDKNISDALILGGSTNLSYEEHPFLRLDSVFHEIGHIFFHKLLKSRAISNSFDEMFADVVASTYLNNPCRVRKKDRSCARNLSFHAEPLNIHLWRESDAHARNAPVAHFMWDAYTKLGLEKFSKIFIASVNKSLLKYPEFNHQMNLNQLKSNKNLYKAIEYINDFSVYNNLSREICVYTNDCQNLNAKYLGEADLDLSHAYALISQIKN